MVYNNKIVITQELVKTVPDHEDIVFDELFYSMMKSLDRKYKRQLVKLVKFDPHSEECKAQLRNPFCPIGFREKMEYLKNRDMIEIVMSIEI